MTQIELLQWRKKTNLTQTELGNILGVTKTCIYRWEAGDRHIPPFLIYALQWLELKGGDLKVKGKKKREKEVKQ